MALRSVLTGEDRESISRYLESGCSYRVIAQHIGRHHSVVAREVARHGGRDGYRAVDAIRDTATNMKRPKVRRLESDRILHDLVNDGLAQKWSPRQVSERLRVDYPDDPGKHVSHETIYQSLFLQARGELRTQLQLALRSGRARRVPRSRGTQTTRGQIVGMVNISERPAEAEDRAVPGFWEGDLIIGKGGKSQIATLVERQTRFVILVRIPYDRTADRVAWHLAQKMKTLPEFLRHSITWDQGKEMAAHTKFTTATNMPIYFCDPHSPWQRGTNENTNGLLRQYFPKGTDLSTHTQTHLDTIAHELNHRPRQTLNWKNPQEKLNELLKNHAVASTT